MPSNLAPAGLIFQEESNDSFVFLEGPLLFNDVRVQVVVPSLSALLANSTWQFICDLGPVFGTVSEDQTGEFRILFLGPGSRCHFLPVAED